VISKVIAWKSRIFDESIVVGFSLHEMLILLVIVGLLSMVAIPVYRVSVLKDNREDGVSALINAATRMEQFYLDSKTYTMNITDLGYASDPATSIDAHYELNVLPSTKACPITTCYVLQARAVSAQQQDTDCNPITLSSSGVKAPSICW